MSIVGRLGTWVDAYGATHRGRVLAVDILLTGGIHASGWSALMLRDDNRVCAVDACELTLEVVAGDITPRPGRGIPKT